MSEHKTNHDPARPAPRSHAHLMGWYAGVLLLLLLFYFAVSAFIGYLNRDAVVIPDEKAVAAETLAKRFTGPRYFQVPPGDLRNASGVVVPSAAEPHITTAAARIQMQAIVEERKLSADETAKVQGLIDRLAEPPSSRLVGAEHINLLRLNLALDALR